MWTKTQATLVTGKAEQYDNLLGCNLHPAALLFESDPDSFIWLLKKKANPLT